MEHRAPICLAAELQEVGGSLRVQGRELPGHGAARVHSDPAQKVFTRWLLVSNFLERRQHEVRRIPLPGCEYPGEWLWAMPRSGLTLLPRGLLRRCLLSDSSAGLLVLGVALRPPSRSRAS